METRHSLLGPAVGIGAALMLAFAPSYFAADSWVVIGGLALGVVIFLGSIGWGYRNRMEPNYFIAAGLLLVFIGLCWQMVRPSQVASLRADFDRLVAPRELTEAQAKAIESYLLPRPPQKLKIAFAHPNSEASNYAGQFHNAFRQGGWEVTMIAATNGQLEYNLTIDEGLRVHAIYPRNLQGGTPKPVDLVQEVLSKSGVSYSGFGSSGGAENVPETILYLLVGHKPRI